MNPNISVEKVAGETNRFTITQVGEGAYLMPGPGVFVSYGGDDFLIQDAERLQTKPPQWVVTADFYAKTSIIQSTDGVDGFTQLITPNPEINCTPGLCLVYAREVYGIGPKYPTAMAGWEASGFKHEDKDFPADVWVPVWFSLTDNPAGHVAVRQPDGSIWSASHPTDTKPVHHESLEEMERYFGGRLSYLGWTQDIESQLVAGRA